MMAQLQPQPLQQFRSNHSMVKPCYWDQAIDGLMEQDRIMRRLIPQFPSIHLASRGNPFVTLARSIVGQQISVQAAESVWQRVLAACEYEPSPQRLLGMPDTHLCKAGLSRRKVEYIQDLARHFLDNKVHPTLWDEMDDESVVQELTQIRGIGRWTAEMFLIFFLMRPDVLPLDDVGLLRAISLHYYSGEPVSRFDAREVSQAWEPWRTVATWYLWRSLDPVPVEY